jgi:hypothetical protein
MNTGVSLATAIPADPIDVAEGVRIGLSLPVAGSLTLTGAVAVAGSVVVERASRVSTPLAWEPLQTNQVSAGAFAITLPTANHSSAFFRVRMRAE